MSEPEESGGELVPVEMGLLPFSGVEDVNCPKCLWKTVKTEWHACVMVWADPMHPCEAWVKWGLLTQPIKEHLCRKCANCGYGWPERTAG